MPKLYEGLPKIGSRIWPIPGIPLIVLVLFLLTALFAPLIAPYPPNEGSLRDKLRPPVFAGGGFDHPLGTDAIGRDILSRLIYGARVSISISFLAITVALLAGCGLGLIAGYFRGTLDIIIMRAADMMLSLPSILIALVMAIILGPSLFNIVLVLGLILWARWARVIRSETLSLREKEFVALAVTAGSSSLRILWRHIMPNLVNTLIVLMTLEVGHLILLEASLSFLGVGIPPPTPTWGKMIADGRALVGSAWWVSMIPGVAILLVVLSGNLLGDWLRDRLDPRFRVI